MNKLHEIFKQYEKEPTSLMTCSAKTSNARPSERVSHRLMGQSCAHKKQLCDLKETIVRFLTYDEMLICEEVQNVKAYYLRVGKQIKA